MKKRLLVVDDEPAVRELVRVCLEEDYDVFEAEDVPTGLALLREQVPDVLIADVSMPGGGGRELVTQGFAHFPDLAVIVITGGESLPDFVDFFRLGVADYLRKPFALRELRRSVLRALASRHVRAENAKLRSELGPGGPLDRLVGDSDEIRGVKQQIARVAPTDATVLVTGSSGTGKELVARAVHELSPRARAPFVAVHCGALAEGLLESELFGHVRGAFTGADRTRSGCFEEADGGTLFLDEIGTMTEASQLRLLRVLQERKVARVGDDVQHDVDVRVVAATNADLESLVARGGFREDLYYRLNVFPIQVPELADRAGDVALLANHFVDVHCKRMGRPAKTLSQEAARRLALHDWPGNVRELENALERAVILSERRPKIEPGDLLLAGMVNDDEWELPETGIDLPHLLRELEADLIRQALERTRDNKQRAADFLGIGRTTLVQKLRRRPPAAGPVADAATT